MKFPAHSITAYFIKVDHVPLLEKAENWMESMEKVKQGISGYGELYRIRGKGFLRPWEGLALPPKNSTEMGAGAAWY